MSQFLKTIGCVFVILFIGVVLRELGFRGARLLALIGTIGILAACVLAMESISEIFEGIGQDFKDEYAVAVMKIIGIGYVSGMCSDVCLEFGEISLANSVLLFGKAEMLLVSAPCVISIVEKGLDLLG